MAMYPTLVREIGNRGIKLKTIAATANMSERTLYNKMQGIRPFTWPEVKIIWKHFFPDLSVDELFQEEMM